VGKVNQAAESALLPPSVPVDSLAHRAAVSVQVVGEARDSATNGGDGVSRGRKNWVWIRNQYPPGGVDGDPDERNRPWGVS
jgi:hypothetical protein